MIVKWNRYEYRYDMEVTENGWTPLCTIHLMFGFWNRNRPCLIFGLDTPYSIDWFFRENLQEHPIWIMGKSMVSGESIFPSTNPLIVVNIKIAGIYGSVHPTKIDKFIGFDTHPYWFWVSLKITLMPRAPSCIWFCGHVHHCLRSTTKSRWYTEQRSKLKESQKWSNRIKQV